MDPAHVVFLIGVFITVVAIAGYLIAIAMILKHVVNRLVTILGAVEAVTATSRPVGPIVDEINRDLDAGRKLIEETVARLEADRVPVGATSETAARAAERHSAEERHPTGSGDVIATDDPPPTPAGTEGPTPEGPPAGGGRGWWNR